MIPNIGAERKGKNQKNINILCVCPPRHTICGKIRVQRALTHLWPEAPQMWSRYVQQPGRAYWSLRTVLKNLSALSLPSCQDGVESDAEPCSTT